MTVIFTNNYSDIGGSYRRGWQRDLPDGLARQLIASGTAEAVDTVTPPAVPPVIEQPAPAKAKRTRKPKAQPIVEQPEQYVTQQA